MLNKSYHKPMTSSIVFDTDSETRTGNPAQMKLERYICEMDARGQPFPKIHGRRILDSGTYKRLKNAAMVLSADHRCMAHKVNAKEKERLQDEKEARRVELQKYGMFHTKGAKLDTLDREAHIKTNYLLNRAFELQQDQEDEIKKCNSLITGTKCLAIRSAQMIENDFLRKKMKEEERRVEALVEQTRLLEGKRYVLETEAERLKKKLQATDIKQQIKENLLAREYEAARILEESRIRTEANIEAQRTEVQDYKDKLKKQAVMRTEFLQINEQLKDMKKIEKELEKIEVLQLQEYNRQKNERDMAFEEEVKLQKAAKEREVAKIQASHKSAIDIQSAKDELNALRAQEQIEQEWRRKEQEETEKRMQTDEELKNAREKQIEDQKESHAYEMQREKEEFDKIIKLYVNDVEKSKKEEKEYKMKVDKHRENLLKQIHDKEFDKIQERKLYFHEGIKYQEDENARKKSLRATMQKKIDELKKFNLPDQYIQGLERQLKLTEKNLKD